MENSDENDPFASITQPCFVSDSQEEILRRRHFAHSKPSSSQNSPIPSTVNGVVSPSENSYETPLQASAPPISDGPQPIVSLPDDVGSGGKDVDLGRDSELGFDSEVQLTQGTGEIKLRSGEESPFLIDSEESGSEAMNDGFSCEVGLGDSSSPWKKLKLSKKKNRADEVEAEGKGRGDNGDEIRVSMKNTQPDEPIKLQESNDGRGDRKNDKSTPDRRRIVDLLAILKILKGEDGIDKEKDERLSKMSILEVAKQSGMTFPRPRWWPDEGFDKE